MGNTKGKRCSRKRKDKKKKKKKKKNETEDQVPMNFEDTLDRCEISRVLKFV